jgi:hypothetical protein
MSSDRKKARTRKGVRKTSFKMNLWVVKGLVKTRATNGTEAGPAKEKKKGAGKKRCATRCELDEYGNVNVARREREAEAKKGSRSVRLCTSRIPNVFGLSRDAGPVSMGG